MKTPITYYGGKQNMLRHILPLIPEHGVYVEPFFGGGAVFFAKEPCKIEVINDINDNVINFYRVCQTNFDGLKKEIDCTLYSRSLHNRARIIYNSKNTYSDVEKACAFFLLSSMSYGGVINSNLGTSINIKHILPSIHQNKKKLFTSNLKQRFEEIYIENRDALKVISSFDSEDTFHYLDPPYVSSDQGYYKGYTIEDFKKLLDLISKIKGKFLLSSYPESILMDHIEKYGWNSKKIKKPISVNSKANKGKTKIECLVWNYEANTNYELFKC